MISTFLFISQIEGTALGGLNGRSNVYNVSSATLTSYTSYNADGGDHSLDESSMPNHYGLPTVDSDSKTKNHGDRERQVLFSVRSLLIVLALSVHSIFEGMAIGEYYEYQINRITKPVYFKTDLIAT